MVDLRPLRGWRYDVSQVGSLADVVAPPYDVIGPAEQKALYERHPCNVVRLILNRDEPGDDSGDARYERAANFLRQWKTQGILRHERDDALYVYHQEFTWEGRRYVRKGFLGRCGLEEFGQGQVFPHEQTMSGPKADRLALTKACKTNLSPIFGLYPDDEAAVQQPLEEAIRGKTPLEVTDGLGVIHRMWPVSDHTAIAAVQQMLADRPIFIADGHHRYETALNYRRFLQEQGDGGRRAEGRGRRAEGGTPLTTHDSPAPAWDESAAANFVLMMFVGMSDPGLAILPTHRLISGLPEVTSGQLAEILGSHFELETIGTGDAAARQAWELMDADGGQDVFGFGTAADGQWVFARLTDASPMADLCPDQTPAWRALGVSLLHKLVLDHFVQRRFPESTLACRYVHLMDEVTEAMAEKSCRLACLVAPAGIGHVRDIASQYEKMPAKSTFFYPKLLSGLVFNPLE